MGKTVLFWYLESFWYLIITFVMKHVSGERRQVVSGEVDEDEVFLPLSDAASNPLVLLASPLRPAPPSPPPLKSILRDRKPSFKTNSGGAWRQRLPSQNAAVWNEESSQNIQSWFFFSLLKLSLWKYYLVLTDIPMKYVLVLHFWGLCPLFFRIFSLPPLLSGSSRSSLYLSNILVLVVTAEKPEEKSEKEE